mgnify:CR=1 FL=1
MNKSNDNTQPNADIIRLSVAGKDKRRAEVKFGVPVVFRRGIRTPFQG